MQEATREEEIYFWFLFLITARYLLMVLLSYPALCPHRQGIGLSVACMEDLLGSGIHCLNVTRLLHCFPKIVHHTLVKGLWTWDVKALRLL